ncbi:MAG: hypothetical protein WA718_07700 [Terriglobales bacterium]
MGTLPQNLIERWIGNDLNVNAEVSLFTTVSKIEFNSYQGSPGIGSPPCFFLGRTTTLSSDGHATLIAERCRSPQLLETDRRRLVFGKTRCEIEEGKLEADTFAELAWFIEKNGFFEIPLPAPLDHTVEPDYFLWIEKTRVTRGHEVHDVEGGGEGPFRLWLIQRAIDGVAAAQVDWGIPTKCPKDVSPGITWIH